MDQQQKEDPVQGITYIDGDFNLSIDYIYNFLLGETDVADKFQQERGLKGNSQILLLNN
jgi:hypothetical protein